MTPQKGPVSIRCRRVYPPLLHEWGTKGAITNFVNMQAVGTGREAGDLGVDRKRAIVGGPEPQHAGHGITGCRLQHGDDLVAAAVARYFAIRRSHGREAVRADFAGLGRWRCVPCGVARRGFAVQAGRGRRAAGE
jgi:hypothetical protein